MPMGLQPEGEAAGKACPFSADRQCLREGCMAWDSSRGCRLIPGLEGRRTEGRSPFEERLLASAPLMYRTLIDLVKIMEDASMECRRCGPELWGTAQEVRRSLLDGLIRAELDELGIRADREEGRW